MSKLYLVRRSLENYLGPMSLAELIVSFKRLEFGLQDEVATSCNEWCSFDDVATLKRLYPELSKVVQSDLLGGWEVEDHAPKKNSNANSRRRNPTNGLVSPSASSGNSPSLFKWVGLLICGIIFAFVMTKVGKLKLSGAADGGDNQELTTALQEARYADFEAAMSQQISTIVPKASKSKKIYQQWVPILRAYAFLRDGSIEGFSPALLRGAEVQSAPMDCSAVAMRQLLRSGESASFDVNATKPSDAPDWLKLAFWDSWWINRRQPVNGWVVPKNYYAACLMIADRILDQYANTEALSPSLQDLRARWRYIAQRFGAPELTVGTISASSPLSFVNCIDRAIGIAAVSNCEVPQGLSIDWQNYLNNYKSRSLLFLSLRNKAQIAKEQLSDAQEIISGLPSKDSVTGFSYQAEALFIKSLSKTNGVVSDALKQVQDAYPEITAID